REGMMSTPESGTGAGGSTGGAAAKGARGLLARLLHGAREPQEQRWIDEGVARVLVFSPQLRMARRPAARLGPAVGTAGAYLVGLVRAIPPARAASAAAWAADPGIHAFFAAPGDIAPVLSRSEDLRA